MKLESPLVEGSYWYRLTKEDEWQVVAVDRPFESDKRLYAWFNQTDSECYPVSELQGEFKGPIPKPEVYTPIYKRYIVFAFDSCYPSGGLGDICGSFDTLGEATLFGMAQPCDYMQIVDRDTWETLSIS